MLSVLAEYQRELIIANTRDGVAAARARGRSGGRRPRLTSQQAAVAQQLYDAGQHTVAQIAAMFSVPRSTIYGHLDKTTIDQRPAVHPGETATAATAKPRLLTPTRVAGRLCVRYVREMRVLGMGPEPAAAADAWRRIQDFCAAHQH